MRKKEVTSNLLLLIFLLLSFQLVAQSEAAIWYFGGNAGLDFNSGAPVVLTDGQLNTLEGCSTISDSNGQLLFYSDGITVWDKNHDVMPNGTNLFGDPSSTQSGIIVPNPGNVDLYYIFTVDNEGGPNGLRYSEVDMNLNNGNGDVTSTKNVLLETPTTEKISAVMHDNNNDIWVMTHGWGNTNFSAYLVTDSGVNSVPVVSSIGSLHNGSAGETIGYLKFSPSGEKLAVAKWFDDTFVEVFDFDNQTGQLSNAIHIDGMFFEGDENGVYGIEFSANSDLLYASDINLFNTQGKVHQFDLTSNNEAVINASDVVVFDDIEIPGALQLAIDQKIYVTNTSSGNLDVIENPDVIGVGCNYIDSAIDLQSGNARYGLPPFIQSFFSVGINVENTCLGSTTIFSIDSDVDVLSILWNFGDGNTSTETNPEHTYTSSGDYTVTVTIETLEEIKTFEREITIYNIPIAFDISNFEVCDDDSNDDEFEFNLASKDIEILGGQSLMEFSTNYFATLADAENHDNILPSNYINTSNNQEIFVKIYNSQNLLCYDITSFMLIVHEFPMLNTVDDIITCDNEIVDGSQVIIFENITPIVLGSQSEDVFSVTYHINVDDANSGDNELPNVYSTISNSQEIFYRIENSESPECYDVSSFNVIVDGQIIAYQPNNMYLCDDGADGFETFNLPSQNAQIMGAQAGNYTISYYLFEIDAIEGNNSIQDNYSNIENPQTIYARIERNSNSNCFDTTFFDIQVLENPVVDIQDTYYMCSNEDVVLSAPTGFDGYLWSTNETTSSITVTEAGTYTVEVTQNYIANPIFGCSTPKIIQVIESDEAIFQTFEIEDWTANNNSITVFVDGIGDYEYSLDNMSYQDSNVFNNLLPGEYNVFIRDKNGCGVITEDICLLYYPEFFTPNGDSYNPYWQIKMGYHEPNIEIYIYNRYGKFITKFNSNSLGWDGTYNGQNMPSDDYWFLVKRPSNGKTYKGHFALRR